MTRGYKSFLTASSMAAAFAFASTVYAADIVEEPFVEPVSDWTGLFLGVHFGVAGGDFDYPIDVIYNDEPATDAFPCGPGAAPRSCSVLEADFELESSGLFGGGQIGFNWQLDNFLIGAVGDISWTNLEGDFEADIESVFGDASLEAGSEIDWFGTIRGRFGWLWTPSFMTYVTGGAAVGEIEAGYDIEIGGFDASDSVADTEWGWTLGGGAEYKITENLTFFGEYLYIDLGSRTLFDETFDNQEDTIDVRVREDTQFHTMKIGFNWLF